jgi:hypothetical protein
MLTAEEAGIRMNWRGNGCVHVVANRVEDRGRPTITYCLGCAGTLRAAREAAEREATDDA